MIRKIFLVTTIAMSAYAIFVLRINREDQKNVPKHITQFTHMIDGQPMNGITAGNTCNPAVLFIHGAPGSWHAWARYISDKNLLDKLYMIAVDRPGYAGSGNSTPITNLKNQTAYIMNAALKHHKGPFIIVGHSFGGPVQIQASIDYADNIAGQIILAGALNPKLHHKRFYHVLGDLFFIKPLLSKTLKITNKEMLALQSELEKQSVHLAEIKSPITLIQGEDDWLVPPGNADFIKKQFTGVKNIEIIRLKQQGHFLPWEQYDLVKKHILKYAEKSQCTN